MVVAPAAVAVAAATASVAATRPPCCPCCPRRMRLSLRFHVPQEHGKAYSGIAFSGQPDQHLHRTYIPRLRLLFPPCPLFFSVEFLGGLVADAHR